MANDPYAVLGVARSADEKAIKSAYRKLAKELHPDHNKDNPKAAERFSEVTGAYDLLSDKDKRARFDRGEIDADGNPAFGGFGGGAQGFGGAHRGFGGGGFGGGGPEGVDMSDIFEGLFGGGQRGGPQGFGGGFGGFGRQAPPPRGANVNYRLSVSLPDAATGAAQRITLQDGKTIDLKLPKGVEDGMQMRLAGKGEPGPGGAGDAIVTITIQPHPFFRLEGDNVLLDLPISLSEALAGGKVKAPTVEGAVMLTVAPGSSSGKTLRLKGRGFTRKDGTRGDQLVRLEIVLPDTDSEAGRELAEKLGDWHDPRDVRARFG